MWNRIKRLFSKSSLSKPHSQRGSTALPDGEALPPDTEAGEQDREQDARTTQTDDRILEAHPEAEALWQQGLTAYEAQNWQAAGNCWQQAVKLDDRHATWWEKLGEVYQKLGQFGEAIQANERAISLTYTLLPDRGNNVPTEVSQVKPQRDSSLTESETENEAEEDDVAEPAQEEIPTECAKTLLDRGMELAKTRHYDEALKCYDKAIERCEEEIENEADRALLWYERGIALDNLKRYKEAVDSYTQAVQIDSHNASIWNNRGFALEKLGRYEEAIHSCDKAIDVDPAFSWPYNNRGAALEKLGRYEEAIKGYNMAVKTDPKYIRAWKNLGLLLEKLQRYGEAAKSYTRVLESSPNDDNAYGCRGHMLWRLGRYSEAIEDFNKAIDLRPNYQAAYNGRGIALQRLKRFDEAITSYTKAIHLGKHDCWPWNNRGTAYADIGNYDAAIADYTKAIELKPDKYMPWSNRGIAKRNLRKYKEAISDYKKSLELSQESFWRAWEEWGLAILKSKSQQEGEREAQEIWRKGLNKLKELLQAHPENSEYREGCGELSYRQGLTYADRADWHQDPLPAWRSATSCYREALQYFQVLADSPANVKARIRYLDILKDYLTTRRNLGTQPTHIEQLVRDGTDRLQGLLKEPKLSKNRKKELVLEFGTAFNQLNVDILLDAGEIERALEVAEQGKNTCLEWLILPLQAVELEEIPSPGWNEIQQLLTPQTAAVYWNVSPVSVTTFLLKYGRSPEVLELSGEDGKYPPAIDRYQQLHDWLSTWKKNYRSYCQGGKNKNAKSNLPKDGNHPWRQQMSEDLKRLARILDIDTAIAKLAQVKQIILFPHRDLHLLPLEALFPEHLSIARLPSAKLGLDLNQFWTEEKQRQATALPLVNLEHPQVNLQYAELESKFLAYLYRDLQTTRFRGSGAKKENIKNSLYQERDEEQTLPAIFHFTGHGMHDLDSPADSALLLADSERLTLKELYQWRLPPYYLAGLSACETGMTGKQGFIYEFVGLASGFLVHRCANVISTLWRVEEMSNALLVLEFYRRWLSGKSLTIALAEAKLWLRDSTCGELVQWCYCRKEEVEAAIVDWESRDPSKVEDLDLYTVSQDLDGTGASLQEGGVEYPFQHPYYWAGFVLYGQGDRTLG